jgi:hypothetical protein
MKKIYLLLVATVLVSVAAFAQSDTTYKYFNKNGVETTKGAAYTYVKFYKKNDLFHGEEHYAKNGVLKSDGSYTEMNFNTPVGNFNNYGEDGKLDFTGRYDNGKPVELTYFYKSGNKKSWVMFSEKGVEDQKGWDENGKEIKNYVVFREARFKGGLQGWSKYLGKNLNANVPVEAGVPAGKYEVKVLFDVSKEGLVSKVKAVTVPEKCKPCGPEAVSAISGSPEWEPAQLNGEPVAYRVTQFITFEVAEDRKAKK